MFRISQLAFVSYETSTNRDGGDLEKDRPIAHILLSLPWTES